MVASLSLLACSSVAKSTYLEPEGFHVVYTLTRGTDGGFLGSAVFRDGDADGSFLELTGGDVVRCDGRRLLPPADGLKADKRPYEAVLEDGAFSRLFTFERPGSSVIGHAVEPPAPLLVEVRGSGAPGGELVLFWGEPERSASIEVVASSTISGCPLRRLTKALADTGSYRIAGEALAPVVPNEGEAAPASCPYTFVVTRTRSTPIGGPYRGGELRAVASATAGLVR
jgi:hypothetical protein